MIYYDMPAETSYASPEQLIYPLMTDGLPWSVIGTADNEVFFQKKVYDQQNTPFLLADRVDFTPLATTPVIQRSLLAYMNFRAVTPRLMDHLVTQYQQISQEPVKSVQQFFDTIQPPTNPNAPGDEQFTFDDYMNGMSSGRIHQYLFGLRTFIQALDYMCTLPSPTNLQAIEQYENLYMSTRRKRVAIGAAIIRNSYEPVDRDENDFMFQHSNKVYKLTPQAYFTVDEKKLMVQGMRLMLDQLAELEKLLQVNPDQEKHEYIVNHFLNDITDGMNNFNDESGPPPQNFHRLTLEFNTFYQDSMSYKNSVVDLAASPKPFVIAKTLTCPFFQLPLRKLNMDEPDLPGYIPLPDLDGKTY